MFPERIGPYVIEKKIGAGGMGNVYLGRHEGMDRVAAVKVLPPELAREEGFVLRFNREVQALSALKNSHIVELFESGEHDGTWYYAMEYVDGETLSSRIRREKRIPWRQVVDLTLQLCIALKAAHDAGIIHRDLKPSNLMISKDGVAKLTDFGVAQVFATSKLTVTGGIVGTAEYMSPEQGQGRKATKRSDLYSLGAMMYVMLTGKPPFSGNTAVDVIQQHRYKGFDKPRSYVPEIPSWLEDLVCQLLEKEPEKRPPDAYVVLRKLQEVVAKVDLREEKRSSQLTAVGPGGGTVVDQASYSGEGEIGATFVRDMVRNQIEQRQMAPINRLLDNVWVLLFLLALVLSAGFWLSRGKELTDEEMFATAEDLMMKPPGSEWIKARDQYLKPLLQRDNRRWEEAVRPYIEQIELFELETNLGAGRRRGKLRTPQSEIERWLGLARHSLDLGDYTESERVLRAIKPLIPKQPEALSELATRLQSLLDERRSLSIKLAPFIESQLSKAQELADNNQFDDAREIWESLLALYGTDPAAASYMRICRDRLQAQRVSAPESNSSMKSE